MVREISELLADSVDARARSVAGLTPAADDYATVVRTVRRRRVVRRSLQTLAVVPLVGGLAAGAYFGLDALRTTEIGPAITPTPTDVIESPPHVLDPLEKGELVTELGLPPYFEAPELLRRHVEPGWSLLTYRPEYVGVDGEFSEPLSHVLFLADLDGSLYRMADLPIELDIQVLDWEASEELARVSWQSPEGEDRPLTVGWLDITTGEVTADDVQFDQWAAYLGKDAHGAELWAEDPAYVDGAAAGGISVWAISPDGSRKAVAEVSGQGSPRIDPSGTQLLGDSATSSEGFEIVDIASGDVRSVPFGMSGQTCVVVGWLDAASVSVLCHDPVSEDAVAAMDRVDFVAQKAGLYRVETAAGGEATLLHAFAEGEPVPEGWSGVADADGRFAFVTSSGFPGGCSLGVGVWDGSVPRVLQGPGEHGANTFWLRGGAGQVLAGSSATCEAGGAQAEVVSFELATGAATPLTGWLEGDEAAGVDSWVVTVTSAALAS